jgi:hypothetical protein
MQATAESSGDLSGPNTQRMSQSLFAENLSGVVFVTPIEPNYEQATVEVLTLK